MIPVKGQRRRLEAAFAGGVDRLPRIEDDQGVAEGLAQAEMDAPLQQRLW